MHRIEKWVVKTLNHPPNWLKAGQPPDLSLAKSYRCHPINLISIAPSGLIFDGNSRIASMMAAGMEDVEVLCCVSEEPLTEVVSLESQFETSDFTKLLNPYQNAVGNRKWLELTGKTAADLAARRFCDPASISRNQALWKCERAVQEAASESKITESDWVELSKMSPDDQLLALTKLLDGEIRNRQELGRLSRKQKDGDQPKVKRIKFPLPSGYQIIVSGADMSLDDMVEALTEGIKHAKASQGRGYTAKTFSASMKDIVKAGS